MEGPPWPPWVPGFKLPIASEKEAFVQTELVGGAEKPVLGSCPQGEDSLVEGGDLQQFKCKAGP